MPTQRSRAVRGFTLIEMLVAVAITLVIMASVVSLFASVNSGITQSMGSLDVQDQIRTARNLLVGDLANLTVNPSAPPFSMRTGQGGLEVREGGEHAESSPQTSYKGDYDDLIWCTVSGRDFPSSNLPLVGEPTAAEVIWFTQTTPGRNTSTLYRRVLPILPGHGEESTTESLTNEEFYVNNRFNVSRRFGPKTLSDGTPGQGGTFNTLSDLGLEENRHGYQSGGVSKAAVLSNLRNGTGIDNLSDVAVLENVVGFDVRVWDPGAPLIAVTTDRNKQIVLQPGDSGYSEATGQVVGFGAYVDLNYVDNTTVAMPTSYPEPHFSSTSRYSTWSRQADAGDAVADGLDVGGQAGVVDDPGERTVQPDVTQPLKGIEVKIRVFEPKNQTIREVTVRQAFAR